VSDELSKKDVVRFRTFAFDPNKQAEFEEFARPELIMECPNQPLGMQKTRTLKRYVAMTEQHESRAPTRRRS
jgi:hypothetical protein